jgi:hypothetical protein
LYATQRFPGPVTNDPVEAVQSGNFYQVFVGKYNLLLMVYNGTYVCIGIQNGLYVTQVFIVLGIAEQFREWRARLRL